MQFLSKSDFLKYQVCPSYLWLWKHKKGAVPVDDEEAINRRLEQGNEVERYARKLFSNGVLIEAKGRAAKEETERLVDEGVKVIFQATVITDKGLLAMADIIEFDEATDSWTLYEVKSTNSIKPEHNIDTTFQKVAFEDAGYVIGDTAVIHLKKDYVRHGKIDPHKLLEITNNNGFAVKNIEIVRQQAYDALAYIQQSEEPKGCNCRLKSKGKHCPTFRYLNPDVPEYSVFNITRIGGKSLALLVDDDTLNIHDVPDDIKLSVAQRNQVEVAKSERPIINRQAISELLSGLEYPLYFLDYETVSTALPMFDGCKPFQQVPFQYSLHVLREPDDDLEHYEYLAKDGEQTPVAGLLASMRSQIGDTGSVIVWYKGFETARNREMAGMYLEYADFLYGVNERVFDLMDVFSKQHYVHHQFNGSSSIKKVLPVLVPEFSYKELDIQNGATASIRWYDAVMDAMTSDEAERTFEALLKYCCLDTLAMVKIYEHISTVSQ